MADQNLLGSTVTFTLEFTKAAWCELATLGQPDGWSATTEFEYVIGDSGGFYEVPAFMITEADCEIAYSVTSNPVGAGLLE